MNCLQRRKLLKSQKHTIQEAWHLEVVTTATTSECDAAASGMTMTVTTRRTKAAATTIQKVVKDRIAQQQEALDVVSSAKFHTSPLSGKALVAAAIGVIYTAVSIGIIASSSQFKP